MFKTYPAKLQVFMSTKSVLNWAIISGFGRPPLQNSNMAGNNWESWGEREVTSSNQDSKNNLATLVRGKWVPERFLQLLFTNTIDNSNWTRPCMTTVCQLVVVLCRIATTVQTREKEFLSIILLPAALFYQFERDSCPHITRTSTQPAVLLFAPSISLMTVFPCYIISEDPWNALHREQFPQHGRKKNENDILSCHCCALT